MSPDGDSVDAATCFHCGKPVTWEDLPEEAPECCELHEEAWWCSDCIYGDQVVCETTCVDCNAKLYCEKYTCRYVDEEGDGDGVCGAGMCRACHEEDEECGLHRDPDDENVTWSHF